MSDIWNEFEKIAVAQGLVSVDDELVSEAQNKGRKQKNPSKMPARYDSLSDDAIRLLYGLEPESIYDKNKTIIEIAHPETAVVGRAYDAMNAVVENLHQRQDMMAYIALKQPNGHLTMRRYVAAKQDLVNSLVRSAFLLDNREETELMALADDCAHRLEKKSQELTKEAIAPIAVVGIAGAAAAVLAGVYWFTYGATTAQSVFENAHVALQHIEPLISNAQTADLRRDLSIIKGDLEKIMKDAQGIYRIKGELINVRSAFDATEMTAADEAKGKAVQSKLEEYVQQLLKIKQAIPAWVGAIKAEYSLGEEGVSDWWAKMRGVEQYLPEFMQSQRFADEKFIEKLWGKPGVGSMVSGFMGGPRSEQAQAGGQVGGLLEAVNTEIQTVTAIINKANSDVQMVQQPQMAPGPAPAPRLDAPIAQAPASGLPAPSAAPAPSQPGSAPVGSPPAAAARRPQSPLEELAGQWGV
jgi:hypothetical protein